MVRHCQSDRCHSHLEGHSLGLYPVQYLVQIESPMQADRCSRGSCSHQIQQTEDVRRRGGDLEAILRAEIQRGTPVGGGQTHREMGVPDRLRKTGRPRAEDENRLASFVDENLLERGAAGPECHLRHSLLLEVGHLLRFHLGCERRGAGIFDNGICGFGQVECMCHFERSPSRTQKNRRGTELAHRLHDDDELRAVGHHYCDPAAPLHSSR